MSSECGRRACTRSLSNARWSDDAIRLVNRGWEDMLRVALDLEWDRDWERAIQRREAMAEASLSEMTIMNCPGLSNSYKEE
jgi:hypothetical protein